ncbi:MAG: hypothetical protein AAB619_01335 [Patescibacteria group bacterium]
MFREWSIADGPADLTEHDVGQQRTFTVVQPDGSQTSIVVTITQFGPMFGGDIRSFGGTTQVDGQVIEIFGTYQLRDRVGHCQTINSAV